MQNNIRQYIFVLTKLEYVYYNYYGNMYAINISWQQIYKKQS